MPIRNVGAGTFFPNPEIVLEVEAGKEYYLELITTFSAKLKLVPEKKALGKIRDKQRIVPYATYSKQFASLELLEADPVYRVVRERDPVRFGSGVHATMDSGTIQSSLTWTHVFPWAEVTFSTAEGATSIHVHQSGYAVDCSEEGVLSGLVSAKD